MRTPCLFFAMLITFPGLAQWNPDTSSESESIYRSGNVSIGTNAASTTEKFNISYSSWQMGLKNAEPGGSNWWLGASSTGWEAGGGKFIVSNTQSSGDAAFVIDSQRKVGIGITSPSSLLHLLASSPVIQVQRSASNGFSAINLLSESGYAALSVGAYGSSFSGGSYARPNGISLHTTTDVSGSGGIALAARHSTGYITFHSGGDAERMRIVSNGKVGIGTSTPNARLEVLGSEGLRLANSTAGDDYMTIKANHNVSDLNPGASTVSAQITNRRLGHLVFDIHANDNGDSFAIRTDKDLNGEVDEISMVVKPTGNVGIGTTTPDAKLAVNGDIHATEVRVTATVPGPDYVFEKDYNLPTLDEIKAYIDEHKHLPEVPSAKEMEENGINVGQMNMILLKKVEEMTLHLIELKQVTDRQQETINQQQTQINALIKRNP